MFNNLLKSGNVIKTEETRVIDSNTKVAERLQYLAEVLQVVDEGEEEEFVEGFSAGLDAVQVEMLLSEPGSAETQQMPPVPAPDLEEMQAAAQAEIDSMLEAARAEAESIVAAAQAEAEGIRQQASKAGHDEGYQAGYDEGMQIAKDAQEECAQRERELEEYYSRKIDELEPEFVDKITSIYEQIFAVSLEDKKAVVHYLIADAMRNIEGGRNFFIHVSKDDYEYVTSRKDELSQGLPGTSTIEVIEDYTLSESQCFIEAESGIFDCGLGTELDLLKKELTLLSYRQDAK